MPDLVEPSWTLGPELSATARLMVDAVLDIVDEHMSLRGVNLREVTRRVGCAHTNAYNYFGSLDDLLWHALPAAINRLMSFTESETREATAAKQEPLGAFVGGQVEFALRHPGLYRFIWLERIAETPPPFVREAIAVPPRLYAGFLARLSGNKLTQEQSTKAMELIHAYTHGRICMVIAGRIDLDRAELKRQVVAGVNELWRWILADLPLSKTAPKPKTVPEKKGRTTKRNASAQGEAERRKRRP